MAESLTPAQAHERALALHMAGDWAQAEEIYRMIVEAAPRFGPAWMAWGVLEGQKGRYPSSERLLAKASALMPDSADAWSNYGNVLRIQEKHGESAEACRRAIALQPNHAFAWCNLSGVLRLQGQVREALRAAREALRLSPAYVEARVNEGCALQSMGRMEEAVQAFLDLTASAPGSQYGWSCCLLALQYSDRHSAAQIAAKTREFWQSQELPPRPRWSGRLHKIGFVSGDFCRHAVGDFFRPLAENWDHSRHELHLFSSLPGTDHVTKALQAAADSFSEIAGMSDSQAQELISGMGIDLLVDLSGHTSRNRLGLLMLRPAPWIAEFLGFSASTGLRAADFVIGDPWTTPGGHEDLYTERIARLKGSVFCRPMGPIPSASGAGSKRLGSFNNPAKMSPTCLDLWSELMRREPDAVLVLKYRGFEDPEVQEVFAGQFERRGAPAARLEFHGWMPEGRHRRLMEGLDLHLDTMPYTGATTLCDMLEAGVLTPTLAGDRYAARMGASVLAAAGLEDLICTTGEEWLDKCQRLLNDQPYRTEVRARLSSAPQSRLADGKAFAADFQDLIERLEPLLREW